MTYATTQKKVGSLTKIHHIHFVSDNLEKLMIYQFDDGDHNALSYVVQCLMVMKYFAVVMTPTLKIGVFVASFLTVCELCEKRPVVGAVTRATTTG